ncbi:MAG: carboxylating nicotinate-nucleotide diphosphorylase [Polyangiaceae bacterium]
MARLALPTIAFESIVVRALEEDVGSGDVTSEACIDPGTRALAKAVARDRVVVCGGDVFEHVMKRVDPGTEVTREVADGTTVPAGTVLWTARGFARSLLMAERVALNLTQRMCGIATTTRAYVDAIDPGSRTRITDTRKTMPGLRVLDRYAVRAGGAVNHRDDLGSAILIKDNHVAACGGVRNAVLRAMERAPHTSVVECEIDSLDQLEDAISAGARIVLLDNMDTPTVAEAVKRANGRAILEASGGITLGRVTELSRAGVDAISVGALTHSAKAADIGLDFASVSPGT